LANYKPLGVPFDRTFRNDLNENFKNLGDSFDSAVELVSGDAFDRVVDRARIEWLAPVATFADLATTYPDATEGKTAMTRDTGKVYRFDSVSWNEVQEINATPVNEVDSRLSAQLADISLNVKTMGVVGDGVTDDTLALQSVRDHLLSLPENNRYIFFPAGTYLYTNSPNWAMNGLKMTTSGEVIFKYTGNGKAFVLDASSDGVRRFYERISIKDIIIEGSANTLHGFYRRNIVRSHFENIEVREINPTSGKAFSLWFGVSNLHINLKHSINLHNTVNMAYDGLFLTNSDVGGDKPTNETFINLTIEGASIGIRIFVGDNINFMGGTSEACSIYGIVTGVDTRICKFIGMALEANGTADISDAGKLNNFDNCYTQKDVLLSANSVNPVVKGGFHQKITIDAASKNPVIENIYISQYATGGTIVVNGNKTAKITNVINMQDSSLVYGLYPMSPTKARTGITVGASPFQYENTSQFPQLVNISGGTISQILWGNGGDVFELFGATTKGQNNGQFLLMPGDFLKVSYSAAPAMNYIPR
jgi:hypothetical protein